MAELTPGATQQIASNIFTDMVLQEAIKDKTVQVEKELKDAQGAVIPRDEYNQYDNDGNKYEEEGSDLEDELDDLMDEESERLIRELKESRIQEMRADYEEKQYNKTIGHGTYIEIVESEFLPIVTKTKYVVVAFFHKDFERCKIVDMHIHKICREHEECRFVRLDAERAPFFINKLGVQVLPTIIMFVDGKAVDRVVGFDELGGADDFPTVNLTRRLIRGGVLDAKNRVEKGQIKIKRGAKRNNNDSSDSDNDY